MSLALNLDALRHHSDAIGGTLLGGLGGLSLAATTPAPHTLFELLPYLLPIIGSIAPVVVKRVLWGGAAGDAKRAELLRARALRLPEGSPERVKLEDRADEAEIDAAEKQAAAKGRDDNVR